MSPVVAAAAVPRRAIDARALGALLSRALAPEADARPRNAQVFADDLASVLEPPRGETEASLPETNRPEPHAPEKAERPSADAPVRSRGAARSDAPRDQRGWRAGGTMGGEAPHENTEDKK